MRRVTLCLILCLSACGGSQSPTSPTPTPSTPTVAFLAGTVSASTGGRLSGATVTITDGANAGKSTTTNGNGEYTLSNLTAANANVSAEMSGYQPTTKGVYVNGTNALAFTLEPVPAPPWSRTGTGVTVFDMPTSVKRVRIIGIFNGSCQNFVVKIAGRTIVNEILGTCSVGIGSRYDGVSLTSGGVTEIVISSGVQWSFEELR